MTSPHRRSLAGLAALALAAALPARAEAPPSAPAPGSAAPAPPGGPGTPAPHVLTLPEALAEARAHQPQARQARANTRAAEARADEARSGLLPQLVGSASYERTTSNFAARPGLNQNFGVQTSSSFNTTSYWSFGATLSQLVYDFGQTAGRWRAAQASAVSQRDSERAAQIQVELGVQTAYFAARAGKDLVVVARDTLANQEAHLRQIEGFVRAGTRPEIDLAQARTDRANAQVQLINAENAYLTEKAQLAQAMGRDGPADFEVGDDTVPPVQGEELGLDALLAEATRARPDLQALEQQARAQELTIGAVRGAYWPTLGVSTGVTDVGTALDSTVWNWNAAVTLSWNVFQGGLTRAQTQEARAILDAARAQTDLLRQQVRVDVEQARLAVRASKEALVAAGEAVVNARERLRLAEGRYRAGAGSVIELGDAQVALTTAAAQRVQAEYNLSTSRAQLVRALGREVPRA